MQSNHQRVPSISTDLQGAPNKMAPRSNLQTLTLDEESAPDDAHQKIKSPRSPVTPKSPRSPRSPFSFSTKKSQFEDEQQPSMQAADHPRTLPSSNSAASISNHQQAAEDRTDRGQPVLGGFFGNYKASRSSSRLQADAPPATDESSMSRDAERPVISRKVSSQDPTRTGTTLPPFHLSFCPISLLYSLTLDRTADAGRDRSTTRRPVGAAPRTEPPPTAPPSDQPRAYAANSATLKKNKPKPFNLLSRTKSIRGDEASPQESSPTTRYIDPERIHVQHNPIKTAPLRSENDRSFRDMMSSNVRQHSADRQPATAREEPRGRDHKEFSRAPTSFSTAFRDGGGGHAFLTNLRNGATKGAGALSKGLFGKSSRSGSTTERAAC